MTETYSLSATGVGADNDWQPKVLSVPDSAGRAGSQALAMQLGTQILVRNPDGSQSYYTIDATRYVPGQPPVLLKVT